MDYPIEVKIASKNGWSLPQEVPGIWGKPYSRTGITIHWWGGGETADKHDNIVNYLLSAAAQGLKSTNYVLSDNKITLMVSPDNVAWASNGGNPSTISIEHQPTLGAEGYKKSGWLVWQLEERYGKRLNLYRHSDWTTTQCPGTIDLNRIRAEADKWQAGGYNPAPPVVVMPTPPPAPNVNISYSKLPSPVMYKINKPTNLWNFNSSTWPGVKPVKQYAAGELVAIYGVADNHTLKAKYGMTQYSFGTADSSGSPKATNGFNMVDLDIVQTPAQPVPTPPPVQAPEPTPVPPTPTVPAPSDKDKEQDERLNAVEKIIKAVVDFLKSIFSGFKG